MRVSCGGDGNQDCTPGPGRVIGYVIVTLTLDTLETPATLVRAMLQMAGLLLVLHLQTRDWW